MKKIFILTFIVFIISSCGSQTEVLDNSNTDSTANIPVNSLDRDQEIVSMQPEYKAELYGKVKQIEGNIFTISEIDTSKDPTINMEAAEKQAYMQALPEADRLALKELIASSVIGDVKVMIPVGIPMVKKELVGEDKKDLEATLEDLKSGDIVSVWYNNDVTDRKVAMYVKRSLRK